MARKRTTVPTKPDDARVQRSVEAMQAAVLALLEQKSLDQISIKEIAATAGISYPTFFRRFNSKEDLLRSIGADEINKLLQHGATVMNRTEGGVTSLDMFRYVQSHRTLWEALLNRGAADAMRAEFLRVSKQIGASRPQINPWLPAELSIAFVASGFFEILAWWMRQPPDYPVENVAIFFDELIGKPSVRRRDVRLHEADPV